MQPLCQPFAVGTQSFFHLRHQTDSCRVCGTEFLGKCPECFLSLLKVCIFFFFWYEFSGVNGMAIEQHLAYTCAF